MQEIRDMNAQAALLNEAQRHTEIEEMAQHDKAYSMGFVFNCARANVLLIRKLRPAWQEGLLNGVGGHIEPGERPLDCMVREFEEEAGVLTAPRRWNHFATMSGSHGQQQGADKSHVVYCYEMVDDAVLYGAKSMTDELLQWERVKDVFSQPHLFIPNLPILLPLALHRGVFQRPVQLYWPG